MHSNVINLTDKTNYDVSQVTGDYRYYANNGHAIQRVSDTRVIVAFAATKLRYVNPYYVSAMSVAPKIYFKLIDISGSQPVVVNTYEYTNNNHLVGIDENTRSAGTFQFDNGDVFFSWSINYSDLTSTSPTFDDGRGNLYMGNGLLAVRLSVVNDAISLVYGKLSQHPSSKSGWASFTFKLTKMSDTLALKSASGSPSYTEDFNLSTGLPVNGTESAGSMNPIVGNYYYSISGNIYYKNTVYPKTTDYTTSIPIPAINGISPSGGVWWIAGNRFYTIKNNSVPKNELFEYTIDANGFFVASRLLSMPFELKTYTSQRYYNNLGLRNEYEDVSLLGGLRTFWVGGPNRMELLFDIGGGQASICHITGEAQHGDFPVHVSGPIVFHNILEFDSDYPFGINPAQTVLEPQPNWDGHEYGRFDKESGWSATIWQNSGQFAAYVGGKYIFVAITHNDSYVDRLHLGSRSTIMFTVTP